MGLIEFNAAMMYEVVACGFDSQCKVQLVKQVDGSRATIELHCHNGFHSDFHSSHSRG
jgi:hypothetical protein